MLDCALSFVELAIRLGVPFGTLRELASNTPNHYHCYRSGRRLIAAPAPLLKRVQRRILRELLDSVPLPNYIHGSVRGHSPLSNADSHLSTAFVIRVDVKDFFPSITGRQVDCVWSDRLQYNPAAAHLLTRLTTLHGRLPQGAPTSPALANLVLLDVDDEINTAAASLNCTFTRYVDDIVISGQRPQQLLELVVSSLRKEGFRVARRKVSVMSAGQRQEVTGLSVNSKFGPSVPRYKRSKIRAAINSLRGLGTLDHQALASIRGRIQQVSRTNPGSARALNEQLSAVLLWCGSTESYPETGPATTSRC
jgi:RNA-directed DNA polymerase